MSQFDVSMPHGATGVAASGDGACWANETRMEHQILEHVKRALRVTQEWKVPAVGLPRKMSSVQFMMKSFQRHLDRVMRIEEDDGYMRVVAECKPNMDARVARLRSDHESFRQQMAQLVPRIDALTEVDAFEFDEICEEIGILLDAIDRHGREEIELLQDSMLSDEGGEG